MQEEEKDATQKEFDPSAGACTGGPEPLFTIPKPSNIFQEDPLSFEAASLEAERFEPETPMRSAKSVTVRPPAAAQSEEAEAECTEKPEQTGKADAEEPRKTAPEAAVSVEKKTAGADFLPDAKPVGKKRPRKKMSVRKKFLITVASALVLLSFLISGHAVASEYYGPEKTAERFLSACVNGDFPKVMEYTGLKETDFFNEKTLQAYAKEAFNGENIQTSEPVKIRKAKDCETGRGLAQVHMRCPETEVERLQRVVCYLTHDPSDRMFFVERWRVKPDQLVRGNFRIKVPKDAAVRLDHVYLSNEYLCKDTKKCPPDETWYEIPALFFGSHTLSVETAESGIVEELLEIHAGSREYHYTKPAPVAPAVTVPKVLPKEAPKAIPAETIPSGSGNPGEANPESGAAVPKPIIR